MPSFELDYDGRTGKRKRIPEYDPALHIRQFPLWHEMKRRIPGVGFNRVWRSIPPGAQLLTKTRLPGGGKAYRHAMLRARLDDLERILNVTVGGVPEFDTGPHMLYEDVIDVMGPRFPMYTGAEIWQSIPITSEWLLEVKVVKRPPKPRRASSRRVTAMYRSRLDDLNDILRAKAGYPPIIRNREL